MNVRILILALLAMLAAPLAGAERVNVVGTRVFIEPPEGFLPAPNFPGFVNPENRAVISVSEVPASYMDLDSRFNDTGLRAKGLDIVSRESLEKDGLRAQLVKAEQTIGRAHVVKWMLITGDLSESVVITASFIDQKDGDLDASLESALRDSLWESSRSLDHFDGLNFKLNEIPGLRISTRVSNTVIFTRDGRLPDQYYTGPMLIVRWVSYPDAAPKERREHAKQFFLDIELVHDTQIDDTISLRLDKLRGYETTGQGKHRFLGYHVSMLQAIAYDDKRFFVAQGFSESKSEDRNFDLFRTVIGSFAVDD